MKLFESCGEKLRARLAVVGRRRKLASRIEPGHKRGMRYLIPAAFLFIAACAPRPSPEPTPAAPPAAVATPDRHDHRTLNGMTANELIQHFGRPRLQLREGDGTKLQFAGPACMLDTYLYPGQGGVPRVTHIEARNLQGGDLDAQNCVYAIESAKGVR